ncbi:hypothetical protein CBR_g45282 [Chara braunii]|uniref:Uncharacterized protein n=1 Tax=Chara braunii TaxID=69332 RepID=A0A388LY87_CHABU|nr:hypothetical protein CBR_g45282 [Chara braunii]|eukprot:GBG87223.1 hypothetical protein CBR_g45282 [Chara braunii]
MLTGCFYTLAVWEIAAKFRHSFSKEGGQPTRGGGMFSNGIRGDESAVQSMVQGPSCDGQSLPNLPIREGRLRVFLSGEVVPFPVSVFVGAVGSRGDLANAFQSQSAVFCGHIAFPAAGQWGPPLRVVCNGERSIVYLWVDSQ